MNPTSNKTRHVHLSLIIQKKLLWLTCKLISHPFPLLYSYTHITTLIIPNLPRERYHRAKSKKKLLQMKGETHFMAHQSQSQLPSDQPLELQKTHNSEDDLIDQESSFLSGRRQNDIDNDDTQNPSALKSSNDEIALRELEAVPIINVIKQSVESEVLSLAEDSGRERLKRHRVEVAGRVWIPDIWGQEELLKDWIDCSAFDAPLVPSRIMSARAALVQEGRRATIAGIRIENRC